MNANKAVEIKSCCQLTVNNFGSHSCLCLVKRNINPTHNYVSRKSELWPVEGSQVLLRTEPNVSELCSFLLSPTLCSPRLHSGSFYCAGAFCFEWEARWQRLWWGVFKICSDLKNKTVKQDKAFLAPTVLWSMLRFLEGADRELSLL